jgi:DNA-binding beta-propeller fold protein YncE
MLSTLLSPQHYRPRRHRASGVIPIALLVLGLSILLAGCGNDSDQSSPAFSSPRGIALDSANNRTLVVDSIPPTQAAVVAVNSSTGDHAILSDNATGIGPNFLFLRGIALDSANNRALVVDSIPPLLTAVVAVDFSTGERIILSNNATGVGPNFSSPRGIALDSANNRALVVDSSLAAVVAVDLSTGDRTILSDSVTGIGPNFSSPRGIALDSANNRTLVVDSSLAAVVAVDLSTGDRTILSDSVTGMGPNFLFPEGITLDSANNRILVLDSSLAAVIAVEPISGDRIIHAQ